MGIHAPSQNSRLQAQFLCDKSDDISSIFKELTRFLCTNFDDENGSR